MNKNNLIYLLIILAVSIPVSANGQSMVDYTSTPVFTTTDIIPNVMFVIDSSGSMRCGAYPDSGIGDDSSDSHIDTGFNPANKYYGYFDAGAQYTYINNRFEPDSGGEWNGNFLNWLTTRRVDVSKKVLIGGKYEACGAEMCLKGDTSSFSYCGAFRKKYNDPQDNNLSPGCGTTACYYGIEDDLLYFDDDSSPYSGPIATYNIHVLQDTEPAGLMQTIAGNARLGIEYYAVAGTKSGKINVPIKAKKSNFNEIVDSARNYEANSYTPLCRSLYTAIGYYKQVDPTSTSYIENAAYGIGVQEEDPFYYVNQGRYVGCGNNFVIMITDGQPYSDGTVSEVSDTNSNGNELDELALWAHQEIRDLRTDNGLTGNQNLEIYMVYVFGQGGDLMKETAKNGGFVDKDDDGQPDGDMIAGNGDAGNEFDKDDDGIPDNYFEAAEGYELERNLYAAMTEILKRASSGTAVSVLSASAEGEGSLFQSFFKPAVYEGFREISWVGYLNSLWVDTNGNMREDTNNDNALVYGDDVIIKFAVDAETGDTEVVRFADADGDGKADSTTPYETVPLDELNPSWESGNKLALRDPSTRRIKTWVDINGDQKVDPGEYIDFDIPNANKLRPFLGAADVTEAEKIISFIRGENVAGYRDRRITIGGTQHVWKLGDIVYSTPTVVGKPMELYHQYYSDHTYATFYSQWKERGVTVYLGANDGMLHAFKAGTFYEGDNPGTAGNEEHGWYSATEVPATSEGLGDERWAYIPHNLLPHLKWLTYPSYSHVYYVDLKPKITDARIFSDDADHPNGWGTILIGGMRLGGGEFPLTGDFDDNPGTPDENRVFRSAYFVLDITVPNEPVLLGEFTDANLSFTTSYPAIARLEGNEGFQSPEDDEWYFVVGSGPTGYDGSSSQNGHLFVVDLQTMQLKQTIITGESDAFMATPITIDLNLNYNTDVLYVGETYSDAGTWKGKLYRTSMRTDSDPALFSYREDPGLQPWPMTTLISCDTAPNRTPITASAPASMDDDENLWVYFGSGRYYNNSDQNDTAAQYFYGIKDACAYGDCSPADEVTLTDLYDASNITVLTNKVIVGAAATTWDPFVDEVQAEDGWFITLDAAGERVLNRPSILGGLVIFPTFIPDLDICSFGGTGEFYALYYETGTAFYKDVMGTEAYGSDEKSVRSVSLGKGVTSIVGLHVGGKTSATGFIQQSTGAVEQVEVTPALSIRSGIVGWMQF